MKLVGINIVNGASLDLLWLEILFESYKWRPSEIELFSQEHITTLKLKEESPWLVTYLFSALILSH